METAEDEIERFDRSRRGAGWALAATWGPSRWQVGAVSGVIAAYAPDGETISFVSGGELLVLDRQGRRLSRRRIAPESALVTLAADAPRAAIVHEGVLRVIDLADDDRELARIATRDDRATLSGDGAVVADRRRVHRVADGALLAEVDDDVVSLSHDGSLALTSETRARGESVVRLRRVGGPVLRERVGSIVGGGAWASGDERVAWSDRGRTAIVWSARDPGAPEIALRGDVRSGMRFAGDELLVTGAQGLELVARDGARRRCGPAAWILAVTRDGARALVGYFAEVELATGRALEAHVGSHGMVTRLAWHPDGSAALVLRAGGDLRIWDVARWETERVIDPDFRHVVRTHRSRYGWLGWERVDVAFTSDGTRIAIVGAHGDVTLLGRDGAPIWTGSVERLAGFTWESGRISQRGDRIAVVSSWSRAGPVTADGNWETEGRDVMTFFDLATGAVTGTSESAPRAEPAPRHDGLPTDPLLGEPRAGYPSPDGRTLLVATASGHLVRLDRVE